MSGPRKILVTGASRGLGRALVEHFLDSGDQVLGCSRGPSDLAHTRYAHVACDVSAESGVVGLFAEARQRFGTLDVLVNNAGAAAMNPIALTTAEGLQSTLGVNFVGTFLCTRAAIRLMPKAPHPRIVNTTTVAVPFRLEGEAAYASAKAAVETFTRIAARELSGFGITVNAVGPSPIHTDLTARVPPEKMQRLLERQAIAGWAEPADVINVVEFFLRPESRRVTGQVVYLCGAG
jgi:3-oxoacyl-[acyl-carrier protein] reductase